MTPPRIVIVGGGFAGYYAARTLCRKLRDQAEVVILNPTDYFLYLPLLPEVAGGVLDPRRVTVSIPGTLPRVGWCSARPRTSTWQRTWWHMSTRRGERLRSATTNCCSRPAASTSSCLSPASRSMPRVFADIAEALYLRDHITLQTGTRRQHGRSSRAGRPADLRRRRRGLHRHRGRRARRLMTTGLAGNHPRLAGHQPRWLLIDTADRVLPGLGASLARTADRVLRQPGRRRAHRYVSRRGDRGARPAQ